MLATVQAIVGQTLRNATSLEDAGVTLASRIQSMDAANDLLVNERWESAPMHGLVERALAPFRHTENDRFDITGPVVRVPPRVALGLALALHELSTNAVKFGALSTSVGRISITWQVEGPSQARRLHLRWEEAGGPVVVAPTRVGFGSKLIQRVLASEIRGTVALEYPPTGVILEAVSPLPEIED